MEIRTMQLYDYEEVMALFEGSGSPCFTQWPRVLGKGVSTGPKMDNDVWPGANSAIMTILTLELGTAVETLTGRNNLIRWYIHISLLFHLSLFITSQN